MNKNTDPFDSPKAIKRAKIAVWSFLALAAVVYLVWAASFLRGL